MDTNGIKLFFEKLEIDLLNPWLPLEAERAGERKDALERKRLWIVYRNCTRCKPATLPCVLSSAEEDECSNIPWNRDNEEAQHEPIHEATSNKISLITCTPSGTLVHYDPQFKPIMQKIMDCHQTPNFIDPVSNTFHIITSK
jgi:hypothetical protein